MTRKFRTHASFPVSPLALLALAAGLALAGPGTAAASGFYRFQHGGRATGQVGAFTARADEPSAIFYNPAAITHLDGLQLQAGLDFNNSTDDYSSETEGTVSADHIIEFPPLVYATWRPEPLGPWAVGLGIDTPNWVDVNWNAVIFPPRQLARRVRLELFEVHPVVAYEIDDHWSVGGGLRYDVGNFKQGVNSDLTDFDLDGTTFQTEVLLDARSDVDGLGFDAGVHYATAIWGWGAVYRSAVTVDGGGSLVRNPRDLPADPADQQALRAQLGSSSIKQSLDLPWEARAGAWIAPYPELRIEADLSLQAWSGFEQSFSGPSVPGTPVAIVQRGGWNDVLSARLAVEGDLNSALTLFGGVAWEPSPVPTSRLEPGFPRGDALVYAAGMTYNFPQLSFDLGVSLHDHDDVRGRGQELSAPNLEGRYSSRDTVWSASARWRF